MYTQQELASIDRDQRYPLPEDRGRYKDRIAGADRGDGGVLPCKPGLSAAGRDRIKQQGQEGYPGCHRESDEDCQRALKLTNKKKPAGL